MNVYIAGGIGAGIGQAAKEVQRGVLQSYDIKTRRELQAKEQQRSEVLASQQATQFDQESKLKDMQLQQMQMQLKQLTDNNTKKETYESFSGYRASNGDVKYLNNMLKNPEIRKRMGGANGVYKLDTSAQQDRELLKKKLGLTDEVIDSDDFDPTRYVKTTRDGQAPGTYDIVDLYGAYAKTGYMNTLKKEEIEDLALKSKQLQTRQQELQVTSAEDWLKENPTKTYQDYLQEGKTQKTTVSKAGLISEFAELQGKKDKGELPPELESRYKVLKNYAESDSDEKREILAKGMGITKKYKGNLFNEDTNITDEDILDSKLFAQQSGIKPDTKANRDFKDEFTTLKHGKRLVDDVVNLGDEELSRGIVDTGIKKVQKLLGDKQFKDLSPEDQAKQLKTIEMDTKLGMFLAKYIKSISGTAVADAEFKRLSDLFSGSSFNNVQTLRQSVKTFVDELDKNFKDSAQTNLLDNPATTLDLVKRYKELPKVSEAPKAEGKPKVTEEPVVTEKPTGAPKVGDVVSGYKYIGGNPSEQTSWEEIK